MKHITEIVRLKVRLKVHWDTVENNILDDISCDIRTIISNNVTHTVWVNVSNNVTHTVWVNVSNNGYNNVLCTHKVFDFNPIQQYKDNI
jgi:hypothetical protein